MWRISFSADYFNSYVLKGNPYFKDNDLGMKCDCLPECNIYTYVNQITQTRLRDSIATNTIFIDVHYETFTMMRYRMDIVHTQLDLLGKICNLSQGKFAIDGPAV